MFHTSFIHGAAALLLLSLASCRPAAKPVSAVDGKSAEITVSVAASTKDVIESLAAKFSERLPIKIRINPGSSSSLAAQILEGAPVDLFLSANRQWAEKIVAADLSISSRPLLTNRLVIVVPQGNPAAVKSPEDLSSPRVTKVALAGEQVPAGQYADQALGKLGLLDGLVQAGKIARGQDVRSALSYVERGEAEAGIVYATDAKIAEGIEVVHEFDPALHDEIVYVLVSLKRGQERSEAGAFAEFLQSPEAEQVFEQAGFQRLRDATSD